MNLVSLFLTVAFIPSALAQSYYPPVPAGTTVVNSTQYPNASIEYKETTICETTPGVKGYSGYVRLPSDVVNSVNGPHTSNYFFWFFEARHDPDKAPLAIYLDGGPGLSSLQGAFTETGPCYVNEDSNSTRLNPWSWNNHVNMLYIDQPLSTGFSYDILVNGTFDSLRDKQPATEHSINPLADEDEPVANNTYFVGTFSGQNPGETANSTANGAVGIWTFLQTWLSEFPEYRTKDDRISLWGEAFAGQFATIYAEYFEVQNERIRNGSLRRDSNSPESPRIIPVDTVGLINGWIDMFRQAAGYLTLPFNNTYGLQVANASVQRQITDAYYRPGGCVDQTQKCQTAAAESDPKNRAHNATVNELCFQSAYLCTTTVRGPIAATQYNTFDMGHWNPDPFPPSYYIGYLNQRWVQEALGVPLNFTAHSSLVTMSFLKSGAFALPWALQDLGKLLDRGVQVTMMYGDRDMDVSWIGGEEVSLAIDHSSAAEFAASGYESISVNAGYIGGVTRQYGRLSFSRVFEAANRVPSYQPETAYQIFMRAIFGKDIATGSTVVDARYASTGPSSSGHIRNGLPVAPPPECYIWAPATCTPAQLKSLGDGSAVVRDYIVVEW
uniref:Putative serine carboxypeptidase n=1 Tax=Paecilomyces divaricatus TaxID=644132 RepID=A0A3G1IHI2_PAEDI|nr:putative serine carboxypeptidase [Paecilomyces divaricatus]